MTVPLCARAIAAVTGGLLVTATRPSPPHRPPAGLEQLPLPTVNAGEYARR
jgi:hypothetical protein